MSDLDLPCLSLDSPRWRELVHAYGSAADMPALLRRLDALPSADADAEPWFSLWSALAAAKGPASVAQVALELTEEIAEDVLVWLDEG